MIKSLQDISRRLIEDYDPDKIILFGSRVGGEDPEGGDIDLVIVKKTDKRPLDRRIEVETLLADRTVPIDIVVYTPDEMRNLYSMGSPFVEEIVEKGRLIYMRKATAAWIRDAEEELESAKVLYEHGRYKSACYHSQQSVEKGLKAILLEKGRRPERTHDIVELHNAVRETGSDSGLTMEDAVYLSSIYKGRYPTEEGLLPNGEPLRADTERAVLSAKRFIERLKLILE
jgi:HEPN domain-containing protein/predicted nucleotidyltransferase